MNRVFMPSTALLVLFVLVQTVVVTTIAAANDAASIYAKVQKKYGEGESLKVKFSGTFPAEQGGGAYKGSLVLKRGNKYILEITGRTIICNGKTVWNYDPAQKKVVVSDFRDNPEGISPERVFMSFPKTYRPTLARDKSGDLVLMLAPADGRQQVGSMQRVTMRLQPETLKLRELSVFDGSATFEWIILDIVPDFGLVDTAFEFKPPASVQVVDLRD